MPVPQSSGGDAQTQSASWADRMDDEDASLITPENLPEPRITVAGDLKTVISYEVQDDVVKKITRAYKIERLRVPKAVARRKRLPKFGNAKQDGEGPSRSTTQIADEVFLTLTTIKETLEQQDDDPLKKLSSAQKGMVTCRICKGDHWTTKCPFKDTLGATTLKELEDSQAPPKPEGAGPAAGGGGAGGKYVPPNQRGGESKRPGEAMPGSRGRDGEDDQSTVRVTNLSEEAQEADLRELFKHFGSIRRIFLAKDKITQQSKGFAFVSYYSQEDAEKAIQNLDGHGYDHLILKVEWAKPSKPRM